MSGDVCWQVFTSIQAGAGGDCLQASAGRGFGLPTSAKWTHSVFCWQPLPSMNVVGRRQRWEPQASSKGAPPRAAGRTLRVSYWQPLPLSSASRPTPPPCGGRHSPCLWLLRRRQALVKAANKRRNASNSPESGGRRHPPAPAAIPRSARLRLRWRRSCLSVLLATSTLIRPCCSLRPPVARASRPPPAGSDTRRCSCLRAGRLTQCRWALQPN